MLHLHVNGTVSTGDRVFENYWSLDAFSGPVFGSKYAPVEEEIRSKLGNGCNDSRGNAAHSLDGFKRVLLVGRVREPRDLRESSHRSSKDAGEKSTEIHLVTLIKAFSYALDCTQEGLLAAVYDANSTRVRGKSVKLLGGSVELHNVVDYQLGIIWANIVVVFHFLLSELLQVGFGPLVRNVFKHSCKVNHVIVFFANHGGNGAKIIFVRSLFNELKP
mmetsp:Transcript_6357/g.12575  ORF Transcript_6357/g.12575 Transcript_6357/m.12575 type:complete len:218 (+) Transcript_6357:3434-4087(+)